MMSVCAQRFISVIIFDEWLNEEFNENPLSFGAVMEKSVSFLVFNIYGKASTYVQPCQYQTAMCFAPSTPKGCWHPTQHLEENKKCQHL